MVSKIIDVGSKGIALLLLLFVFSIVIYTEGQDSVAQRFCEVRGFASGFAVPPGIVCQAHIPFPFNPQPTPPPIR